MPDRISALSRFNWPLYALNSLETGPLEDEDYYDFAGNLLT